MFKSSLSFLSSTEISDSIYFASSRKWLFPPGQYKKNCEKNLEENNNFLLKS